MRPTSTSHPLSAIARQAPLAGLKWLWVGCFSVALLAGCSKAIEAKPAETQAALIQLMVSRTGYVLDGRAYAEPALLLDALKQLKQPATIMLVPAADIDQSHLQSAYALITRSGIHAEVVLGTPGNTLPGPR